ncbi:iron complex transport system permease protein [Lachnospiraceae bacterium XPB1003]|nr:iron complex transport system permease protein [Lachnospiraceae bacterium XPB1003]
MKKRTNIIWTIGIITVMVIAFTIAVTAGRYTISVEDMIKTLTGQAVEDSNVKTVLFNIRLPRALLAIISGAGLAVAGAAFQSMFSNPLATPDTLGVATGASFGATLGIMMRLPAMGIQGTAFLMGIISIFLVYSISKVKGESSLVMLILAGMVISSLFEALVSLVKYVADPQDVLPEITYWLMGSLAGTGFDDLLVGTLPMVVGIFIILGLRWKLNVLSLNEDEARSMGINLRFIRGLTIISSTMITASVIAMCGKVGWIGILIPHVARMIFGNNNKYVIPASLGLGATYLLIIDTVARSISAAELPISILTAIIGAPVFIVLLRKTGGIKA